jgi:bacteriocin biosynthesis cyclodehydratase domain-containing protein
MVCSSETRMELRPEYEIIALDHDSVLVRSPDQGVRVRVDGMRAADLAALISRLDGTESLAAVIHGHHAAEGLDTLLRGLIARDIIHVANGHEALSDDARFFAHFHDDPAGCRRRLAASQVLVCGAGEIADAVCRAHEAAGIERLTRIGERRAAGHPVSGVDAAADGNGQVRAAPRARDPRPSPAHERNDVDRAALARACRAADLVVVCPPASGTQWETAVNTLALETGVAWLPVRIFGAEGFVGPLFIPHDGPCYGCLARREEANWADPAITRAYFDRLEEAPASVAGYGRLPALVSLVSHYAALESTKYLARFTVPALLGNLLRIDFARCRTELHRVLRVPRCAACSPVTRRPAVSSLLYAGRQ